MKTIEMADATESLSRYARKARLEPLIVTVKGKPVAALTAITSETDLENLTVSNDPGFKALIERSRRLYPAGTGLSTTQVRKRLGLGRRKLRLAHRLRVSAAVLRLLSSLDLAPVAAAGCARAER